ncbi:MAG: hypothetical protein HYU41_26615 [Candidatus Rokubacteria bacterium]|nr:hypothetical protein [Candidatus Rokubacteria bacterium]
MMLLAVGVLLLVACNRVRPHIQVPDVRLGEAAFYPTIEAWTRAPITAGNDVEILLNGDEIVPALLGAVRSACSSGSGGR